MKRFIMSLVISIICMMAFTTIDVHGKSHEEKQLEEFIKGNNYISAEKAISQFEQMYEKKSASLQNFLLNHHISLERSMKKVDYNCII